MDSKTKKKTKDATIAKKKKALTKVAAKAIAKPKPKKAKAVSLVKPTLKRVKKKVVQVVPAPPPKPSPAPPAPVVFVKPAILKPAERKPEAVKPEAAKPAAVKPKIQIVEAKKPEVKIEWKPLEADLPITVKDLAVKLQEKPSILMKRMLEIGIFANINQSLDEANANKIAHLFGFDLKPSLTTEEEVLNIFKEKVGDKSKLSSRWPVVTFMGHVDHGKTSLLDAIRKSKVAETEHGGITQHIGAYEVNLAKGKITFLDTPGHEAFTSMRSRGANITDIVVLVVAADDGIMPQTIEAVDHAKAAAVPIVVAVNKIDKPQANLDQVKKQLSELNLTPEDWGGKTITVGVSAKTGQGIDELLNMILLEAEMLELKANYSLPASGVVIEAKLSTGKGPTATLLVQNGTLFLGDIIICGPFFGKIRAMFNDKGKPIDKAPASVPVEALGLEGVPEAGERFYCLSDEKKAREVSLKRKERLRLSQMQKPSKISLDDLYNQIKQGAIKELNVILKADVQGSLEALQTSLQKLPADQVQINFIHTAVGAINVSDVILASASNAVIIGFHVEPDPSAKEKIEQEGVDARTYRVIYEAINDVRLALEGLLEPKIRRKFLGQALVRKVFKLSRSGTVAGCLVQKGQILRSAHVSLVRNGQIVFEGKINALKRFKDDVREVAEGTECGISLAGFEDILEGDCLDAYELEKVARKL